MKANPNVAMSIMWHKQWYRHLSIIGHVVEIYEGVAMQDLDRISMRYIVGPANFVSKPITQTPTRCHGVGGDHRGARLWPKSVLHDGQPRHTCQSWVALPTARPEAGAKKPARCPAEPPRAAANAGCSPQHS